MEDNNFGTFSIKEDQDFNQGVPTLKEIALMHIRKISEICCNEFTKGYWEEKPIKVGGGIAIMRTYHADQRAIFCNAVEFLLWIVIPTADETFKTTYKDFKIESTDWEANLKLGKQLFRDINLMFDRINYFDSQTGRKEGGK